MKRCLIEQSCGLGDILLSLKVGNHCAEQGYKVTWPVEPIYANLKNNIAVEGEIEFPCVTEEYELKNLYQNLSQREISNVTEIVDVPEIGNVLYVPLRRSFYSDSGIEMKKSYGSDACNMLSKFGMCGLVHDNWQNHFSINRNYQKEAELNKILGTEEADKIHLVNKEFGTPPRWREMLYRTIETPPGLKRIEMRIIDGYDLFDWIGIFERAQKIDTVTTANFYIFEKINLQCIPTIYSKNNFDRSYEDNWGWMEKLAAKKYNFVN